MRGIEPYLVNINSTFGEIDGSTNESVDGIEMRLSLLIVIALISILLNFGIIYLIVKYKSRQSYETHQYAFVVNVCSSDILFGLFAVCVYAADCFSDSFIASNFNCKFEPFVSVICMMVGGFTTIIISVNRMSAVFRPTSRKQNRRLQLLIPVVWLVSGCLSAPSFLWKRLDVVRSISNDTFTNGYVCVRAEESPEHHYYPAVIITFVYCPLTLVCVAYFFVMNKLDVWRKKVSNHPHPHNTIAHPEKDVKMFFVITMIYLCGWIPFNVQLMMSLDYKRNRPLWFDKYLIFASIIIVCISGMLKPIVYVAKSDTMRKAFRMYMPCGGRKKKVVPLVFVREMRSSAPAIMNVPEKKRKKKVTICMPEVSDIIP